jgi:hypothetical protein
MATRIVTSTISWMFLWWRLNSCWCGYWCRTTFGKLLRASNLEVGDCFSRLYIRTLRPAMICWTSWVPSCEFFRTCCLTIMARNRSIVIITNNVSNSIRMFSIVECIVDGCTSIATFFFA